MAYELFRQHCGEGCPCCHYRLLVLEKGITYSVMAAMKSNQHTLTKKKKKKKKKKKRLRELYSGYYYVHVHVEHCCVQCMWKR